MTVYRARSGRPDPAMRFWSPAVKPALQSADGPTDQAAVLGAVREDIRGTLRMAWLDPAIEAAAAWPVFFTAAWSAIRPNVGKSFTTLAATLRGEAVECLQSRFPVRDL